MRTQHVLLAVSALLLFPPWCMEARAQAVPVQPARPGVSLGISGPEKGVPSGDDVPVQITITNISKREITEFVPWGDAASGFGVLVRDAKGQTPPETPYLRMLRREPGPSKVESDGTVSVIFGGDNFTRNILGLRQSLQENTHLNRLYDMSQPGEYAVQVARMDSISKVMVQSNIIKVVIGGPSLEKPQPPFSISISTPQSVVKTGSSHRAKPAFSLTISTSQHVVKAGSEIMVKITMTNISHHDIYGSIAVATNSVLGENFYEIEVKNHKGVRAPLTRYGYLARGKVPPPDKSPPSLSGNASQPGDARDALFMGSVVSTTIPPEESSGDAIIANKLYDLSQPGKYSIQVTHRDPESKTTVRSNTITVTVVPIQPTFSLAISTPYDVVMTGSEVRVRITLTNTSNHDIGVNFDRLASSPSGEEHYGIEVQNDKGIRAPLTRHGHRMRGEVPDPPTVDDIADDLFGSDFLISVKPRDVTHDTIIANKMYDLIQPGKYSIQVNRWDPESNTMVKSNTITVTVAPVPPESSTLPARE